MIAMNKALFENNLAGETPVLVEFWAPWCVYCRRIAPAMEKIAQQYEGKLTVGQVNIDEEPLIASKEQIEIIPTLILYKGGQALGSIVAPESRAAIQEFLEEALK